MSQIEPTESTNESSMGEPSVPRLSIADLLLWTSFSALYLFALQAIYRMQGDPGPYQFVRDTHGVIHGIVTGAAITGVVVLAAARRRRGPPMLVHPGHWLMFVEAITAVAALLGVLLLTLSGGPNNSGSAFPLMLGIIYLFPSLAYGLAAQAQHYTARHWRALLIALSLVALLRAATYFGLALMPQYIGRWMALVWTIPTWGNVLLATAMLFASCVEIYTGPRRDWLHWTGIVTQLTSSAAAAILLFA